MIHAYKEVLLLAVEYALDYINIFIIDIIIIGTHLFHYQKIV